MRKDHSVVFQDYVELIQSAVNFSAQNLLVTTGFLAKFRCAGVKVRFSGLFLGNEKELSLLVLGPLASWASLGSRGDGSEGREGVLAVQIHRKSLQLAVS